jgi:PAS domain S-box-containing protein
MKQLVKYLPFVALLLLPLTLYPFVDASGWTSSSDTHAAFEFAASLLALTAGIMILLNYFSTGRFFFLIISLGFVLIGTEEFVHAIFSFNRIWPEIHPTFKLAISSTWLTGRFILAASLLIALLFGKKEVVPAKRVSTVITFGIIGLICAAIITAAIFVSPAVPTFVQLGSVSKKLLELCLALLFFIAFLCYANLYFKQQSHSPLLWSIIACIIFEALVHVFVFDSQSFYDSHWDAAHLLVIIGYFFPIFGIWGENLKLQRSSQLQVIALEKEITERKKADEALRESESRYRALFDHSLDCVYLHDLEGNFIEANKAALDLLGYQKEEITTHNIASFLSEDQLLLAAEATKEMIQIGHRTKIDEYRMKRKDGEYIYIETRGTAIRKDGKVSAVLGIARDITERKRAEEKLVETSLQLVTSNEELRSALADKDVLLKEVHHRVKNNLMVISSLLNLQMDCTVDEAACVSLRESDSRIMSMAIIHEQVLQSGEYAYIDCLSYVNNILTSIRNSVAPNNKDITLKIDIQPGINIGLDQAVSLGLIINELVSNSFKHAFQDCEKGEVSISCRRSEDQVQLSIQDNGVGMRDQVDMDNPSSLGLQLVKLLVEQLDGTIKYEKDGGSKFTIMFNAKLKSIQEVN